VGALLNVILLGLSLGVLVSAPPSGVANGRRGRWMLLFQALLSGLVSTYLVFYVIGEDDYRDDGTSRWEAYNAHAVTTIALAAGYLSCVLSLVAVRRDGRLARVAGLTGVVAAVLLGLAFIANSLN
jgi:heme/copper-type cytochrome/quinol oxidase subunit 3